MKLITKQIERQLAKYPIYSQEQRCFFGLVENDYGKEFGYFTQKELESIRLPFGLRIERDIYFEPTKLNELN